MPNMIHENKRTSKSVSAGWFVLFAYRERSPHLPFYWWASLIWCNTAVNVVKHTKTYWRDLVAIYGAILCPEKKSFIINREFLVLIQTTTRIITFWNLIKKLVVLWFHVSSPLFWERTHTWGVRQTSSWTRTYLNKKKKNNFFYYFYFLTYVTLQRNFLGTSLEVLRA